MTTYVLLSEAKDKIQDSGLLQRYEELSQPPNLGYFTREDVYSQFLENQLEFPEEVKRQILSIVEIQEEEDYQDIVLHGEWKLGSGEIVRNNHLYRETQLDLFDIVTISEYPLYSEIESLRINTYDFALTSGYYLPERFSKEFLSDYRKYGFDSYLEFMMTLSAYRVKDVLSIKSNEYQWKNSKGVKNMITACVHGDPKFFQYDESEKFIISPLGEKISFYPRKLIGSMTEVYHHMEDVFFGSFFRYVIECGKEKEIFGEKGEKIFRYIDTLPNKGGNYGDAGLDSGMEEFAFKNRVKFTLERSRGENEKYNYHSFRFAPGKGQDEYCYEAFIDEQKNFELQIFSIKPRNIGSTVIRYYPEDCEHLIKGLLWQCANGHGRTGVNTLKRLIEYYYSDAFLK